MTLKSIIETVLFAYGDPMALEKIARLAKSDPQKTERALEELKTEYEERGLSLIQKNGSWQLGTSPANAPYLEAMMKNEFSEELSRAALETVAIIAYRGPISRSEIEFVRGVNSSFTMRNLLMRGMIERIENPKDARAYLYRISFDFLKHFGITRTEDLPQYEAFQKEKMGIDSGEPKNS